MKKRNIGDIILIPKGTAIFSGLMDSQTKTKDNTIGEITNVSVDNYFITPKYAKYDLPDLKPKLMDMGFDKWSVMINNVKDYEDPTHQTNVKLEKHIVCAICHTVGTKQNCMCRYLNNYDTVELEFDVCNCCGNMLSDGICADTEFNEIALNSQCVKEQNEMEKYKKNYELNVNKI